MMTVEILPDLSGFAALLARETVHSVSDWDAAIDRVRAVLGVEETRDLLERLRWSHMPTLSPAQLVVAAKAMSVHATRTLGLHVTRAQIDRALRIRKARP